MIPGTHNLNSIAWLRVLFKIGAKVAGSIYLSRSQMHLPWEYTIVFAVYVLCTTGEAELGDPRKDPQPLVEK